QDVINPVTDHTTVMIPSPDYSPNDPHAHPYWYAWVLGLFHAGIVWFDTVRGKIRVSETIPFLWVCWLGEELGYNPSFKVVRLPKISFILDMDPYTFGFLDPVVII
ncbi:hypothetical protein L218DRAFT_883887, partial [Marasmius fiardii PR-910]